MSVTFTPIEDDSQPQARGVRFTPIDEMGMERGQPTAHMLPEEASAGEGAKRLGVVEGAMHLLGTPLRSLLGLKEGENIWGVFRDRPAEGEPSVVRAMAGRSPTPGTMEPYGPAMFPIGLTLSGVGPIPGLAQQLQPPSANVPLPRSLQEIGGALRTIADAGTSENITLGGAGAATGVTRPMLAYFLGDTLLRGLPESAGRASAGEPGAAGETLANVVLAGMMGVGLKPGEGVRFSEQPKQLKAATGLPTQVTSEQPASVAERPEVPAVDILPVPANLLKAPTSFEVTPEGKAIDVKSMTPEERTRMATTPVPPSAEASAQVNAALGGRVLSGVDPTDFNEYRRLTELMRGAVAKRDFEEAYRIQQQIEPIKNKYGGFPPSNPEDLRPAIEVSPGNVISGEAGQTHAEVLEANGIDPKSIDHYDERRGFVDINNPTRLISRSVAEQDSGLQGTAKAGGLDSQDLPAAKEQNAIRELRTDSISETQSSGSVPPMEEKVRGGADAQSEARQEGQEGTKLTSGFDPEDFLRKFGEIPYWMSPSGELNRPLAMSGVSHYESAAQILKKFGDTPRNMFHEMRDKGYAKITEQLDDIYITGSATTEQLKSAASYAEQRGKSLYHDDKLIYSPPTPFGSETEGYRLYSGVDIEKIAKQVKGVFDHLTVGGQDVSREASELRNAAETKARNLARQARHDAERQNPNATKQQMDLLEQNTYNNYHKQFQKQWVTQLSRLKSPSGRPFLTQPSSAPADYVQVPEIGASVHPEYANLIRDLVEPSQLARSDFVGKLLAVEHGIKHTMLAADTYHLFRVLYRQTNVMGKPSFKKGFSALEYSRPEMVERVKSGELPPEVLQWRDDNAADIRALLDKGINVGRLASELYSDFVRQIPILGGANKWIFEKGQRGAMIETGVHIMKRLRQENPKASREELASKAGREVNVIFGNLQRLSLIKNPALRDLTYLFQLSPEWTESNVMRELGAIRQTAEGIKSGKFGTLSRQVGAGILTAVIANQLINMAFQGHPTWDNDEKGYALNAKVPDLIDKSEGYHLPVLPEDFEQFGRYRSQQKDRGESEASADTSAILRMAANKASPVGRAAGVIVSGRDYSGRKLTGGEKVVETLKSLAPVPLPLSKVFSSTPGEKERQLASSLGLRLEPVERKTKLNKMTLDERLADYRKEKSERKTTYAMAERAAEFASTQSTERAARLHGDLSRADRNWLESRNLRLPGWQNTLAYEGERLPLTRDEDKRLVELMKEEYSNAIKELRKDYDNEPDDDVKAQYFSEVMADARDDAKDRLYEEITKKQPTKRKYNTRGLGQ